ncbi:hypothetical protein Tco_1575823 [Tanacetum coccineum]
MFRPKRYESARIIPVGNLWCKDRPCEETFGETFDASIVPAGTILAPKVLKLSTWHKSNKTCNGQRFQFGSHNVGIRDGNKIRTRWGPDPQIRIDWGIPELTRDGDGDGESPNYETGDGDNINPRPRRKIPQSPWGSPIPIGDGDGDVSQFPDGGGDGDGDEAEKQGWGWQIRFLKFPDPLPSLVGI